MEAQQPHVSVGVSDVEQDAEHRLSASLRAALNLARAIAQEYRVPGEIGTGLLLVAIVRTGRAQPKDASGPAELMKLIDSLGTHSLGSACDEFLERERRSTSGGGPRYDELSPNLNGVLEAARHLPNHDGILAMRHVIVSLLTFRPRVGVSNAHRILDQAGVQRATVHETFVDSLAARGPEPERDGWRALRPSASRPSASRTLRPEYWADVPSGRAADDCLNLDATVSAVANLFASPELDGSLSLGVFGNWGSGKSFFMRRLRLAIDELTAQARAQAEPWATPVYWPNIVQVEFNAWHYVDSNLWASLVAHLLQQLRDFKPGERSETQRTQLQKALSDLNLAADLHAAAERARAVAADAREVAERSLKKAEEDATEAERSLAAALGRSLWSYVEEELKPEQRKVRQSLEALHAVGQQTSDALQPVYKQIQSLTSTGGQVHAVLSGMIRAPDATRKLVELCGIMALPLIALVLLRTYGPQLPTLSTAIVGGIASSTAALARGVSWVRDRAQQTMEHLEPLIGFRDRVAAALEAAEAKKAAEVARNEREVAAKSAALEVAKREVRESESRVQSAIEALAAAVNGAGIARFIEQRLASSDYQKHLGLIALVRRDFEQLTQLIQGHNAQRLHLQEDAANIREALRRARPNLAEDELRASFENLGVNRVIIYIDDLDRCPSERVVEVLQAIHLLLAFPVFTVVVGVDARWMAHALSKEFPALLGTAAEKAGVEGNGRVSPSDYLEKIFQIPFWVPPLDELTTCALLDKLAGGRKNEATLAGYSPDDLFGEEGASFGSVQAGLGSGGDSHNSGTYPKLSESLSERSRSTQPGANGSEGDSPHPGLIRPVALALDKTEVQAMRELALVIGRSPRATKRFVNSYRLLKAALTDKERGELGLEPKSTSLNFEKLRTPMLLLAIVTGAPSLAARFLAANPPASASLQDKAPSPLEYLAELARQATSSVEVADTFARVRQFCGGPQRTRWADIEYGEIARWATRVSQFSFEDLASPLAESVA